MEKPSEPKKIRRKRVSKGVKPESPKQWTNMSNLVCGVRQMNGKLCKAPVVMKGKCDIHKEMPNLTHGFYAESLSEEERLEYDQIAVGEIDNELRLARIQLRRVLNRQKREGAKLLKIREVKGFSDDKGAHLVTTKEPIDYPNVINKYFSQIGRLESIKAQIQHMVVAVHDDGVFGFRKRLAEMEQLDGISSKEQDFSDE